MEDSLKKRYIIKLLANIINGLINIVLVAIVPKALGPVAYGQFSYLLQFFSQFVAFLDAGTSTAFFTKLSAKNNRKELITFYLLFSIFLLFILYVFIFGIDFFNYTESFLPEIPSEFIYLGMWFGFLTWISQIYIKVSDAYALTVSVEIIKIFHKLSTLLILIVIVNYFVFNLSIYFYFHFLSLIFFILLISILFIKKGIYSYNLFSFKLPFIELSREFLKFSSPLFIFNIIAITIGLLDIWLLQKMSGSIETGYYGLAYSIAAMCFLFTGAMTPIITREFSKSFASKDINQIKIHFKRYVPMLYAISAYFGVFIAFESENLLLIFADEKFKDAYFVLVIMAFYPIHQTYGQLSSSLFFALEETKLYRNIGIFSSLLGLIFTYIFLYLLDLGAVGFAWKMVLIQIISVNIQLYFNIKFLKVDIVPFIKHQLLTVLFFTLLAYVSTSFLFTNDLGLIYFLIKGFIYTILVFIGLYIFPNIISISRSELNSLLLKLRFKK